MHSNDPTPHSHIADTNIERLVKQAYHPEEPDPAFVERMRGVLLATAERERQTAPHNVLRLRRRLAWVMSAAASLAVIALAAYAMRRSAHDVARAPAADSPILVSEQAAMPDALTARPRPSSAAALALAVGDEIRTRLGERRRVTLPDGSVLFVNQSTTLKVEAERRVALDAGEVFVEVARNDKQEGRFVVRAAGREVAALGTKFAVRSDDQGPRVFVTQGKVQVEGTHDLVHAGEQLVMATGHISPAPRATHLLDWTRELMAAAESPLVPASKHQGGALLAVDPNGQEAKLSLRKFHVDVHIEDGFARTTIDQTYFNHETFRLEGTFYFPLPPDASLSQLAMYVDGVLMQGGMCERDHARQVFETILHTNRDPALLEWVDGCTFKMRVFPLEGRQEKRIILSYTQRLDSLYSQAKYRFPAGHNLEVVGEWSFHARIKRGGDLLWTCDSHKLQATQQDGDLSLRASQKHTKLDRDLTLILGDAPAPGSVRFASADHDGSRYLQVRYRPQLTTPVKKQRRDWVILFESSANRDPLLARVQIDVIRTILTHIEHDDTFAVLTAATRAQEFTRGAVPATPENVRQAVQWLERTHLVGALDLGKAIAAAEPFLKAAKNPHLVHVGAGVATLGERREEVLAKAIPEQVRYVGVGVGKRWSRSFMKQAAERTGGFFTQINPDEPVAWRAFELLATLNTPRLLDVKVIDDAERVTFLNHTSLIADGEELCAVARVGSTQDALPKSVTVTGRLDGKPFVKKLPVQNVAAKADYLPRTWAKLEIDRLLAADSQANKAKIVEFSKAMYVMSPFTSLLVLETEQMYAQFNVDRGRKDHWALYQSPEKIPVVHEPLPGVSTPTATSVGQKPTPEEVLATILVRIPPQFVRYPSQPDRYGGTIAATALQLYQGAFGVPDDYEVLVEAASSLGVFRLDSEAVLAQRMMEEARRRWESIRRLYPASMSLEDYRAAEVTFERYKSEHLLRSEMMKVPSFSGWGSWEVTTGKATGFGSGGLGGSFGSEQGFGRRFTSQPFGGPQVQTRGIVNFRQNPWATRALTRATEREIRGEVLEPFLTEEFKRMERSKESGLSSRPSREPIWAEDRLERLGDKKELVFLRGMNDTEDLLPDRKKGKARLGYIVDELLFGQVRPNLLYERPTFTGDQRVFSDLVSYAPGMNTTTADIRAVLEAEARRAQEMPGRIDPAAKALIERARGTGWQSVRVGGFTLNFDGSGRYAYERTLSIGLREQVVCDGTTLLHLYPELGVGARRTVSRFHRVSLHHLVPWMLPPVEELARNADVSLIDERIVALTPRGAATAKDEDGKPMGYGTLHLVFATDGRLAERRVFEMPAQKLLYRETYDAEGRVRLLDGADKVLAEHSLTVHPAETPKLKPDVSKLVVLPLPLRTTAHVAKQFPKEHVTDNFEKLSDDAALAVYAAHYGAGRGDIILNLFGNRYHRNGDRRLGFYTLIAASPATFYPGNEYWTGVYKVRLDPVAEHPNNPLARYLARHNEMATKGRGEFGMPGKAAEGFVQRLAEFHDIALGWRNGKASGSEAERQTHWRRALTFAKSCASPLFTWTSLDLMQAFAPVTGERAKELAEAYRQADGSTGLNYHARYEQARCLTIAGYNDEARKQFSELYTTALRAGVLPAIDGSFWQAFNQAPNGRESWLAFVRKTRDQLRDEKRPGEIVALAWQCHQIGDAETARELIDRVFVGLADALRPAITLAVVEFHVQIGQHVRADALMQGLLEDKRAQDQSSLWRLAARIAFQGNLTARGIRCLEKALDLEFRDLPTVVNLQAIRQDYGQLLSHYQQLVTAVRVLEAEPPKEFLARVIRAADRWRSLDPEATPICQAAARVLQNLGAKELAWDYLTTPIALKPNEASPWVGMAQHLRDSGDVELAHRAYAAAFEAEATNAQILWDHAQMLQQRGRWADAQPLYHTLAEGNWQPRFQGLRNQARQMLGL